MINFKKTQRLLLPRPRPPLGAISITVGAVPVSRPVSLVLWLSAPSQRTRVLVITVVTAILSAVRSRIIMAMLLAIAECVSATDLTK